MEYPFSEQEQRIRKHWLLATRAFYLGLPLVSSVLLFIFYSLNRLGHEDLSEVIVLLPLFIWYLVMKHCTYKKYGTAFMTFVMVMAPIRLLVDASNVKEYVDIIFCILTFGLYAWWLCASCKLKPVNKKAESWRDSLKFFERSLTIMKMAKDLQELETIRLNMLRRWPESELTIIVAYQERKRDLAPGAFDDVSI